MVGARYNDVALLLPGTIPEAARKLKADASEASTDCSKRWLYRLPPCLKQFHRFRPRKDDVFKATASMARVFLESFFSHG